MDFQKCLEAFNGKYDMLFGRDEILLLGLTLGAKGAVGSTYNYMPKAYLDIIKLYEAGKFDQAKALQQDIIKIIDILIEYGGGIVGGKAFYGTNRPRHGTVPDTAGIPQRNHYGYSDQKIKTNKVLRLLPKSINPQFYSR